jgi:y4mF family transcriptional regulator
VSNEEQSYAISQPDQSGAEDARRFGLMVRARRKAQGLRQEDVASATGVGRRYIVDMENGKPTLRIGPALMIARLLGIVPTVEHALSASHESDLPDIIPEDPSDRVPEDLPDDLPPLQD